jgi:hypothetical protein
MMTPGHVRTDALSAFLDGGMTARERSGVTTHLQTCEECRAHLDALRHVVAVLHTSEPVQAPEGFRQQVRTRIAARASRPARPWGLPSWTLSWKAAAATAAIVVIGLATANVLREQLPVARRVEGPVAVKVAPPMAPTDEAPPRPGVLGTPRAFGPAPSPPVAPGSVLPSLRRVIRTAQVTLEVENVDQAASHLTRLAEEAGGFVAGSTSRQVGGTPQGSLVLRIPAGRFADLLAQLEGLGRVLERRVGGQDVTEEYVDLRARLRNQERYELRLLAFADRATNVSDLLAIEQELARVRGEIEQLTARLQYLERQVDLATIEVAFREAAKSLPLWNFTDSSAKIRAAVLVTIRQLLRAVEALVIALSALLPVALLAGAAWLIIRRVRSVRGG